MYPAEKIAIQVETKVIIASMTAASGSSAMAKFAFSLPAENHVTESDRNRPPGASATLPTKTTAMTVAVAPATIRGQCAAVRRRPFENAAQRSAAASGSARTRTARLTGSDTGGLLPGRLGADPGGRQAGVRGFCRPRRERLGVDRRRHAEFAERLPVGRVERLAPAVEHEEERERHARLARRDRQDEEHEHLPVQVAVVAGERDEVERDALHHHLGAEEHRDQVAAGEEAHQPDAEERRGDREVVPEGDHSAGPLRWAMATAPIVATRSSVPASSTASRWSA